jgi:hypothetical protein
MRTNRAEALERGVVLDSPVRSAETTT